ncbi:MAG: four-carbon acid sugar kinase family protein [Spirochaetaceae bacterium]|jgi:uncharacterized protein YgbK (DUF1537 family)|nr:four-carbon acid sugar kinase family protein [Spirochaetaceae bacterium]
MIGCVVVADDLTGANATGVLMTKSNYRTYSILNLTEDALHNLKDFECIVYPTDSRSMEAKRAYDKIYAAVMVLRSREVKVYSKRIDSTLRGNLGAETDAMLDALGDGRVAMVVPCFPASNRINVGGYLLVNAVPLHMTEAATDPKSPVTTPVCAEIFRKQSKYPVASLSLAELLKGAGFAAQRIRDLAEQGARTVIFDAVSEEDIDLIAETVIDSGVPFIAVDPGVFTATLSRKIIPVPQAEFTNRSKIFVAVGSVNAVARRQVEYFLGSREVFNVYMETREFLEGPERRKQEINRVSAAILDNCGGYDVCSIVGWGIIPERRVPFEAYADKYNCSHDDLSNMINTAIAEITYRVLSSGKDFRGMYTCGGDITVAVCCRLKNTGLKLLGEVLPLASYGEIMGGEFPGLKIVTKGGMVGEADAIVACVRYLKEKLAI